MSKLALLFGIITLVLALAVAPMPLTTTLNNPPRTVTIFPNVLLAVPLMLLGVLFLLYGFTAKDGSQSGST
jgi:hypothetical protein